MVVQQIIVELSKNVTREEKESERNKMINLHHYNINYVLQTSEYLENLNDKDALVTIVCSSAAFLIFTSGVPGLWKPPASSRTIQALTQRVRGRQEAIPYLQP